VLSFLNAFSNTLFNNSISSPVFKIVFYPDLSILDTFQAKERRENSLPVLERLFCSLAALPKTSCSYGYTRLWSPCQKTK
jgi:hypothetical protein